MTNKKQFQTGIFFIVLSVLFVLLPLSIAAAEKTAKIGFDTAKEEDGTYKLPLSVADNEGIMGYYITVRVQSETAVIKGAARGSLTEKGVFDYNVLDGGKTIDILWAGTDEATADGILAYVLIADDAKFQKKCELSVSYSQPDTFDGNYQDVRLDCAGAVIKQEKGKEEPMVNRKETENADKEADTDGKSGEQDAVGNSKKSMPSGKADGKESIQTGDLTDSKSEEQTVGGTGSGNSEGQTADGTGSGNSEEQLTGSMGSGESAGQLAKDAEGSKAGAQEEGRKVYEGSEAIEGTEELHRYKTGDEELDSKSIRVDEKIGKGKGREKNSDWIVGIAVGIGAVAVLFAVFAKRMKGK